MNDKPSKIRDFGSLVHRPDLPEKLDGTAVVVFSGGQDSTTCLGWALNRFARVQAITFSYGQKHEVEVGIAAAICESLEIPHHVVDLAFLPALSESALTSDGDVNEQHRLKPGLPASFVPNRNALFFTLAHAWAQKLGAEAIVTGVCQTDYSGYPDCRAVFVEEIEKALNTGSESRIVILAPLMDIDKAETWALAKEEGILNIVIEASHTCYNGDREHRHDWGYGCGACPACRLRAKGWLEYQQRGGA